MDGGQISLALDAVAVRGGEYEVLLERGLRVPPFARRMHHLLGDCGSSYSRFRCQEVRSVVRVPEQPDPSGTNKQTGGEEAEQR
jgi:hypothetical protein